MAAATAAPEPPGVEAAARRRPHRRSIRVRITAVATLVVAVVLVLGAALTLTVLNRALTETVAVTLEQDLETIADLVEKGPPNAVQSISDEVLVRLDGQRAATNDGDARGLPVVPEGRTTRVDADGEAYLAASERTREGTLTVAEPIGHVDEAVSTSAVLLLIAVPLVLALVGGVVWVVTGRALAPVERMRRQVDDIDATDAKQRVDADAADELGALAATMNGMLGRVEQAQVVQRQFVSDASHELRSPLATIRQHAEVAAAHPESTSLDALSGVVLAEGARMQELVEGMLLLTRLDERHGHSVADVDLDDLALAEAQRLGGLGVRVDGHGIGPARVAGNEVLLGRALRNLVDNAARHAEHTVTLRVWTSGDTAGQRTAYVQVEDDGVGIPHAQREAVFERFARLDEGRARDEGGSGLGLAIVREVVLAHRGTVTVDEGDAGGARFTVAFPAV